MTGRHRARWVAPLALVMLIGSALADSTPEQRVRLREEITVLLRQFREDGRMRPVIDAVIEIMGPDWRPTREWELFLKNLLDGDDRGQRA